MSTAGPPRATDTWLDFGPAAPTRIGAGGRRAVLVQGLGLAVAGALLYLVLARHVAGLVVWGLALLVLAAGLTSAAARRFLQRLGDRLRQGVGRALAWLLLTPVFFLIFTPAALVMRLLGRDPLRLRPLRPPASYWHRREGTPANDSYTRQFSFEEPE